VVDRRDQPENAHRAHHDTQPGTARREEHEESTDEGDQADQVRDRQVGRVAVDQLIEAGHDRA
jgi:hypothetical protein